MASSAWSRRWPSSAPARSMRTNAGSAPMTDAYPKKPRFKRLRRRLETHSHAAGPTALTCPREGPAAWLRNIDDRGPGTAWCHVPLDAAVDHLLGVVQRGGDQQV